MAPQPAGSGFLARVVGQSGSNVTQASLTSVTYSVYNLETDTYVLGGTLDISNSIYDTLKTAQNTTGFSNLWTRDATGYNFRANISKSAFPDGERAYLVRFLFDPVTGEDFPLVFRVDAIGVFER